MFINAKLGTGVVLVNNELVSLFLTYKYMLLQDNDCEKLYLLYVGMLFAATCIIRLPKVWNPNITSYILYNINNHI